MSAMPAKSSPCGFAAYLGTLFLGALNDNVSKLLAICFASAALGEGGRYDAYLSLAGGCFILPYLLFSNIAGHLADRFSKKWVMVWTKALEIAVMTAGWLLASRKALYGLLGILFVMGAQSAFFSPAKYGFLPETEPPERLSRANGLMQLCTFTAIILGGWLGGMLAARGNGLQPAFGFTFCIGIAVAGLLVSFAITRTPTGQPGLRYRHADPLTPHLRTLKELAHDRVLACAVAGNAYFWFAGTVIQLVLTSFAKSTLQGDEMLVGHLQAVIALGIAAGCCLAGFLSRKGIAYGFIVPAGLALGALLILLAAAGTTRAVAMGLTLLVGLAAGFFELPLSTAMQQRSPQDRRGRYLAATNALDCLTMLAGCLYLYVLPALCGRLLHVSGGGTPRLSIAVLGAFTLLVSLLLRRGLRAPDMAISK